MNFTSQICTTKEQSERLLSLGLKKETADICIRPDNTLISIQETSFIYHNLGKAIQEGYCPAWSLHRLIEIFKKGINISEYLVCSNAYNEIIDDIEYEIKEGHFNKEYLEE